MSRKEDKISEEQLDKLSDADLEFYVNDELDKMSDAGLEIIQSIPEPVGAPEPDSGSDKGGLPDFADLAKGAASGAVQALTLDQIKNAFPNQSPTAQDLGYVAGNIGTGGLQGILALKALGKKSASAIARMLTNMGITGAETAVRSAGSENVGEDVAWNTALAGGLSGTAELLQNFTPPSIRWAGRLIGGLSPIEASLFKANPKKAYQLSNLLNENPAKFSKEVQKLLKGNRVTGGYSGGLKEMLQTASTDPLKKQKAQALSFWGREIAMPWSVFEKANPDVQAEALRIARLNQGFPSQQTTVTRTPIQTGEAYLNEVAQKGLPLDVKEVIPGSSLGIPKTQYDYEAEQLGLPLRQRSSPLISSKGPGTPLPYQTKPGPDMSQIIPEGSFEQQLPLSLNEISTLKSTPINTATTYGKLATQEQYGLPLTVKSTSTSARQPSIPKKVILTPEQQSRLMSLSGEGAFKETNKMFPVSPADATAAKAQYETMLADQNVYSSLRKAQEEKVLETMMRNRAKQVESVKSGVPNVYGPYDPSVITANERVPLQINQRNKMDLPELNENISSDVNVLNKIDKMGANLKSVLTAGPKTELADIRDYLDLRTGSNLSSVANLLSAGEKLSRKKASSGLQSYLRRPVSSALVRTPNVPPLARELVGLPALQAILRSTSGSFEEYD